jgi:hypothetical protein
LTGPSQFNLKTRDGLAVVAVTMMVAVIAVTMARMLSISGTERTSEQDKGEEREQCALHRKISNQADKLICRQPSS